MLCVCVCVWGGGGGEALEDEFQGGFHFQCFENILKSQGLRVVMATKATKNRGGTL